MKIAFKNFITTLRRYKMASVLNIAGLTLAFTAFYVMMVQVTYDLGYNRSIKDAGRILTVNANWIGGGFSLISPRGPFEAALAQCPEVEGSAIMRHHYAQLGGARVGAEVGVQLHRICGCDGYVVAAVA